MPKRKLPDAEPGANFGERLTALRKAAGYSLRAFAAEVGISHRMVVYYEKHSEYPPAHLLPQVARALGVSTDQLLGVEQLTKRRLAANGRVHRRMQQLAQLGPQEQRQVWQLVDVLVERERLKRQART